MSTLRFLQRWRNAAHAVAVAGTLAVALPADAATGFTYSLVKDFPATTNNGVLAPEEALCNFAFNDLGQAAYTASRVDFATSPQVVVTSLYFWDGFTEQLVYRVAVQPDGTQFPDFTAFGCPGYGIGLDDGGLIAVPAATRLGPTGSPVRGVLYFRPGAGLVGTADSPDEIPFVLTRANLNGAGQVGYAGFGSNAVGLSCFGIGTFGLGISAVSARTLCLPDLPIVFGVGGAIVSESGHAALVLQHQGSDLRIHTSLLDFDPPNLSRVTDIGPFDGWYTQSATPGLNRLGYASLVSDGPNALHHATSVFRVALVSPDRQTVSILADDTVFTRQAGSNVPTWLNNKNQVLVGIRDVDPTFTTGQQSLWLIDAARQPLLVFLTSEPFQFGGQVVSATFLPGPASFAPGGGTDLVVNNRGDVMFSAIYTPAGAPVGEFRLGVFIAHPEPGLTPSNPVLPAPQDLLPFGWRFNRPCAGWRGRTFYPPGSTMPPPNLRPCYVDPALATGYTYTAETGSARFASVLIPAPLPGGDAAFALEFEGQSVPIRAGEVFDFTAANPAGVGSFRITGIDPAEALLASDTSAFVTGLTWVGDASAENSFTMVPIADSDADGVEDARDACPGTSPGAAVDPNGCSAAQRDTDGDGVLDTFDACSGTAPGAPVDASGCSAAQRDGDGDGVSDATDLCPGTAPGAPVDAAGCSAAQRDTDGDGVRDAFDACPGTPPGTPVDAAGCPLAQQGRVCDVDRDRDVDRYDIKAILQVLGTRAAGTSDPRDPNRDGRIDLRDVTICISKCDRWFCASP